MYIVFGVSHRSGYDEFYCLVYSASNATCLFHAVFLFDISSTLKKETAYSSETSVDFHHTTKGYIPEYISLHTLKFFFLKILAFKFVYTHLTAVTTCTRYRYFNRWKYFHASFPQTLLFSTLKSIMWVARMITKTCHKSDKNKRIKRKKWEGWSWWLLLFALRHKHFTCPWDLVLCEKGKIYDVSVLYSDKSTTNREKKRDE
jgi:hypothetical protein